MEQQSKTPGQIWYQSLTPEQKQAYKAKKEQEKVTTMTRMQETSNTKDVINFWKGLTNEQKRVLIKNDPYVKYVVFKDEPNNK